MCVIDLSQKWIKYIRPSLYKMKGIGKEMMPQNQEYNVQMPTGEHLQWLQSENQSLRNKANNSAGDQLKAHQKQVQHQRKLKLQQRQRIKRRT